MLLRKLLILLIIILIISLIILIYINYKKNTNDDTRSTHSITNSTHDIRYKYSKLTAIDSNACGECQIKCQSGQSCICPIGKDCTNHINEICVDNCLPGQTRCSSGCVDLTSDNNNCATCDNPCPTGKKCINKNCILPPPPITSPPIPSNCNSCKLEGGIFLFMDNNYLQPQGTTWVMGNNSYPLLLMSTCTNSAYYILDATNNMYLGLSNDNITLISTDASNAKLWYFSSSLKGYYYIGINDNNNFLITGTNNNIILGKTNNIFNNGNIIDPQFFHILNYTDLSPVYLSTPPCSRCSCSTGLTCCPDDICRDLTSDDNNCGVYANVCSGNTKCVNSTCQLIRTTPNIQALKNNKWISIVNNALINISWPNGSGGYTATAQQQPYFGYGANIYGNMEMDWIPIANTDAKGNIIPNSYYLQWANPTNSNLNGEYACPSTRGYFYTDSPVNCKIPFNFTLVTPGTSGNPSLYTIQAGGMYIYATIVSDLTKSGSTSTSSTLPNPLPENYKWAVYPCDIGSTACNNICTNTTSNNNNCGNCGTICSGICTNSKCVCGGQVPDTCNNICTNKNTDNNNCGTCGIICKNGNTCQNGTCKCGGGYITCNNLCTISDTGTCPLTGNLRNNTGYNLVFNPSGNTWYVSNGVAELSLYPLPNNTYYIGYIIKTTSGEGIGYLNSVLSAGTFDKQFDAWTVTYIPNVSGVNPTGNNYYTFKNTSNEYLTISNVATLSKTTNSSDPNIYWSLTSGNL